jgi:hypothetical protein
MNAPETNSKPELRDLVRRKLDERRAIVRELGAAETLLRRDLPAFVEMRKRIRGLRKDGKTAEADRVKAEFGPLAGRVYGLLSKVNRLRQSLRKEADGRA